MQTMTQRFPEEKLMGTADKYGNTAFHLALEEKNMFRFRICMPTTRRSIHVTAGIFWLYPIPAGRLLLVR